MTDIARLAPAARPAALGAPAGWLSLALARPAALLVVLSALFGGAMVLMNPPLRGPDEPAHFVRVYSYAHGVLLPALEVNGRKGIMLPAELFDDFTFYNDRRNRIWTPGFSFHGVRDAYRAQQAARRADGRAREPVFVPYEGTEGYMPVAYAPHILAALVARGLGLDFADTLLLMRFFGLAAFTAAAAYAVAVTPHLKWALFLIALLPASLYGRAVVGADGAALSAALVVVALSLKAALGGGRGRVLERALWMTLCVLAKPPQIVFALLEPMIQKFRDLPARWRTIALVVAPGLVLSPLWVWAVDAEVAAWRVYGNGNIPPEYFSFSYKLGFMLEHPLHFPSAMLATLFGEAFGLWRQLIGVLGWLDTHFHVAIYVALSLAFLPTLAERLETGRATRLRLACYAAATIASYVLVVFLIFFITWTPPAEPQIWGVQGRYFVVLLPLVALAAAALANVRAPPGLTAGAALFGAAVSGIACLEGLWRVNWAG